MREGEAGKIKMKAGASKQTTQGRCSCVLQVLPWTTAGVGVASAGYEHGSEIRQ